jgi:hypothetical protein
MIKKILFIQIISLMLCSCSFFPLEERSVTEIMIIKSQIEDKWVQPVGNLKNINVKISVDLEIDGTVIKADIVSINCPAGADQICQLVAESAKKAIKKASPIKNLRPDRHDIWKTIDLDFYPNHQQS